MKNNNKEVEFKSPFAIVYNSKIELHKKKQTITIPVDAVRKTVFFKKRKYTTFICFFILSLFVTLLATYFIAKNNIVFLFTFLIVFLAIIISLFKEYEYSLLIIKEYDFIELKIKKEEIGYIKKFEQLIKQKIKPIN